MSLIKNVLVALALVAAVGTAAVSLAACGDDEADPLLDLGDGDGDGDGD
jgi:hypothetical protein